eukprot:6211884-Pleurochrysis_carterae.AAC.2
MAALFLSWVSTTARWYTCATSDAQRPLCSWITAAPPVAQDVPEVRCAAGAPRFANELVRVKARLGRHCLRQAPQVRRRPGQGAVGAIEEKGAARCAERPLPHRHAVGAFVPCRPQRIEGAERVRLARSHYLAPA